MAPASKLAATAKALVAPGRGILAADESTSTIEKRLTSVNVANTPENRRAYRELLFTAKAAQHISGIILYEETLKQASAAGVPFPKLLADQNIIPGIKVDKGAKPLTFSPNEKVTEGLDGLRERLKEYAGLGARFTKWRGVIDIDDAGLPSDYAIDVNAHALARYAALSQEAGLVPIVEPEVLMDGAHSMERSQVVTETVLRAVFAALATQRVVLEEMLLKPNMVVAGAKASKQPKIEDAADATVETLKRCVPAAVPGIVFLSGGQSEEQATAHLSAMNARHKNLPWELSFSYGRALQASALKAWAGKPGNVAAGQAAYEHRARMNGAARNGSYKPEMEKERVAA